MKDKAHYVLLPPSGTCRKWTASTLSWLIISFIIIFWMFPFPISVSPFFLVFLSLSLCTEVFVHFHFCECFVRRGVRCLLIRPHLTTLEAAILKTTTTTKRCVSNIYLEPEPSLLYADDHPDSPQCFSHMTVVIQLVTESPPKPSQCRLAQEKIQGRRLSKYQGFPCLL